MVKAELNYNPYLLETKILFNAQPPKINSQVEKYQVLPLQQWLPQLPGVFYAEMNGYDFDLDFSGTALDFSQLKTALEAAKVTTETRVKPNGLTEPAMVRLNFKNELAPVAIKEQALATLLIWLAENPNRQFDYASFHEQNLDFFESPYSLVTIWGGNLTNPYAVDDVVVQNAQTLADLPEDLTNTPVVFFVDETTSPQLLDYVTELRRRRKGMEQQLFFWVQLSDTEKMRRTIHDQGIEKPQLVQGLDDPLIQDYLALYPRTVYVRQAIRLLQKEQRELQQKLTAVQESVMAQSQDGHHQLDQLTDDLRQLDLVDRRFVQRNAEPVPKEWLLAKNQLLIRVKSWEKNKTRLTNDNQAQKFATRYQAELLQALSEFTQTIRQSLQTALGNIGSKAVLTYQSAPQNDHFVAATGTMAPLPAPVLPDLTSAFLAAKSVMYTRQPEKLFGLPKLLNKEKSSAALTPNVTYELNEWRNHALAALDPITNQILTTAEATLHDAENQISAAYDAHLQQRIAAGLVAKAGAINKLSAYEKMIQNDADWLHTLTDQLDQIERG